MRRTNNLPLTAGFGSGNDSGSVHAFEYAGGWHATQNIRAFDEHKLNFFGRQLATNDDHAFVLSLGNFGIGYNPGVYVYSSRHTLDGAPCGGANDCGCFNQECYTTEYLDVCAPDVKAGAPI